MNIIDENIIKSQCQLLKSWRIPIRKIGIDIGCKGIKDNDIIPLLLKLQSPTFFTRDLGFYDKKLCHKKYCLVCMAIEKHEAAVFVRRLLRLKKFGTRSKRMGAVIRISRRGIQFWNLNSNAESFIKWNK